MVCANSQLDNFISLSILEIPPVSVEATKYSCAQLRHNQVVDTFFSVRTQAVRGLGVVTAFFTNVETGDGQNQEIDIEFTGATTSLLWASTWRDGHNFTRAIPLGFDAALAPHDYSFRWRAEEVTWYIDGIELLARTRQSTLPRQAPTRLYISTWLRTPSSWAGQYDPTAPRKQTSSSV